MLETLDVEFMRLQVHGADSSLKMLQEDDTHFDELIELENQFVITQQREVGGVMIDKLTARLFTDEQKLAFKKADAFDLSLGTNVFRYVKEAKRENPCSDGTFVVYADLRANFQEKTTVE